MTSSLFIASFSWYFNNDFVSFVFDYFGLLFHYFWWFLFREWRLSTRTSRENVQKRFSGKSCWKRDLSDVLFLEQNWSTGNRSNLPKTTFSKNRTLNTQNSRIDSFWTKILDWKISSSLGVDFSFFSFWKIFYLKQFQKKNVICNIYWN